MQSLSILLRIIIISKEEYMLVGGQQWKNCNVTWVASKKKQQENSKGKNKKEKPTINSRLIGLVIIQYNINNNKTYKQQH